MSYYTKFLLESNTNASYEIHINNLNECILIDLKSENKQNFVCGDTMEVLFLALIEKGHSIKHVNPLREDATFYEPWRILDDNRKAKTWKEIVILFNSKKSSTRKSVLKYQFIHSTGTHFKKFVIWNHEKDLYQTTKLADEYDLIYSKGKL